MSKPEMDVAIVCGPDCDMETQALRATLEYFGARVFMYWVGRPNDFIDVLSGKDLFPNTDLVILNFHGDEGRFVMPEIGDEAYEEGEPHGDFGSEAVRQFAKLGGRTIVCNGCDLGNKEMAEAFLHGGCQTYIGPDDYPYGNSTLMFVIRFCYELIQNKRSVQQAYDLARAADEDTMMYQLYTK